jgi:hypothetical protein
MHTWRRAAALVLVWAASIHAQTALTGTWHGRTDSGLDVVLELTATDGALTGTLTRDGRPSPITNGNVSKDAFAFNASLDEHPESFTGRIGVDAITVWLDRQGPSRAVTFRRAAPGLSGTWRGQTPNGFPLVLELTAQGTTLSGALIRDDQRATIADGKVSNGAFTFQATLGDQTAAFSGELAGNQITVWMDRQGPSAAAILQRVVDAK